MYELELIKQVLMVMDEADKPVDIDAIAAGLEDDHSDLETIMDEMEENGLVRRLQNHGKLDSFILTDEGRELHEGPKLKIQSTESREALNRRRESLGLRPW